MADAVPEIRAPVPSPDEAAAIVAAVERFLAETAPAPETPGRQSPWQRAALLEGVGRGSGFDPPHPDRPRWGT